MLTFEQNMMFYFFSFPAFQNKHIWVSLAEYRGDYFFLSDMLTAGSSQKTLFPRLCVLVESELTAVIFCGGFIASGEPVFSRPHCFSSPQPASFVPLFPADVCSVSKHPWTTTSRLEAAMCPIPSVCLGCAEKETWFHPVKGLKAVDLESCVCQAAILVVDNGTL